MTLVTNATREKMRDDTFANEVLLHLNLLARVKFWLAGRRLREEARAAFDLSVHEWREETSKEEWEHNAKLGVVDPLTLWLIGIVINLLFQWWIRRRDSNTQTLRIMRG